MRARARNLLLLAAVAATAWIAWMLLREGGRPGPRDGAEPGRAPAPLPDRRVPPSSGGAPQAPVPEAGAAIPGGPRLDLRAVVAGEWPLPGVQVLAVERFRDGSLVAMIGDDAPDGGETDGEGCITLRYRTEPAERLFGVLPDGQEFEGAENAEEAGAVGPFRVFRALSAEPVTLRYRDSGETVLLRPVDAATGAPLAGRAGIVLAWERSGPGGAAGTEWEEAGPPSGGWLRILVDLGSPAIAGTLLVPGYLPSPAPEGGWRGRSVLRMDRDPAAIRGRIVAPEGWTVTAVLRSAGDGGAGDDLPALGLPRSAGEFALGAVPAGEWELVVRAEEPGARRPAVHWAVRRFRAGPSGVDLGDVKALPGAVVRARLTGLDARPAVERGLVLFRARRGRVPLVCYNQWRGGASAGVLWSGSEEEPQYMGTAPSDDGWVEFRGLLPGAPCIVAAPWVPGVTRTVDAPAKPGEVLSVELAGDPAMTSCVVRFTVEGEEPAFWRGFTGPAFPDKFHLGKGVLEADIPPGTYRVQGEAAAGPEPEFRIYEGDLEIPGPGHFEGTVDLRPPAK